VTGEIVNRRHAEKVSKKGQTYIPGINHTFSSEGGATFEIEKIRNGDEKKKKKSIRKSRNKHATSYRDERGFKKVFGYRDFREREAKELLLRGSKPVPA